MTKRLSVVIVLGQKLFQLFRREPALLRRCYERSNSARSASPSNGPRNQVGILDPSYCAGDVTLIGIAAKIL